MALSRKMLKGMGLTEEQADTIVEAHTETVEGLKADLKTAQDTAKQADAYKKRAETAEKELEAAKKDGWKDKHDQVKKEFDDYKADINAKEAQAAKEKAVRAYFESKNIKDGNLNIAMRSSTAEIAAIELEGDKIKDTTALDNLVSGDYASLVSTSGVRVDTGARLNGGSEPMTRESISKIKNPVERQKAIAENIHLYRKD